MERSVKLTLTVVAGAGVGRSWEVPCGVVQRVGATGEADVVLEGDAWMAGAHFALYWVGEECRVRDLSTGRGTWVNGRGVQDEVLRMGDVVQCGRTQLRVEYRVEGGEVVEEDPKARALATLRGLPGKLYAVLDTARDPEILVLLRRSGYEYGCLYSGWAQEIYGNSSPYLVRLQRDGRLLEQLVERGWGKGWGIYLGTRAHLVELRRHLRWLLSAQVPGERVLAFRYFDPEVMVTMIRSAELEEVCDFYGAIESVAFESRTSKSGEDEDTRHRIQVEVHSRPKDHHVTRTSTFAVSRPQLHALAEGSIDAYLDRVATRLRNDFPSELGTMTYEGLRSQTRVAFDRFRVLGFRRKEFLHRLIVLELLFGPRFEDQLPEEAREFLTPTPTSLPLSEVERFWAVYRVAEHLERDATPGHKHTSNVRGRSGTWC